MMAIPVSDALKDLLDRQKVRGKTVGAVKPHAMGWANDLLDQGDIEEDHSRTGGEETRPMGVKGPAVGAPAKFEGLRLVHSCRQRAARRNTSATPCLQLIVGGLC